MSQVKPIDLITGSSILQGCVDEVLYTADSSWLLSYLFEAAGAAWTTAILIGASGPVGWTAAAATGLIIVPKGAGQLCIAGSINAYLDNESQKNTLENLPLSKTIDKVFGSSSCKFTGNHQIKNSNHKTKSIFSGCLEGVLELGDTPGHAIVNSAVISSVTAKKVYNLSVENEYFFTQKTKFFGKYLSLYSIGYAALGCFHGTVDTAASNCARTFELGEDIDFVKPLGDTVD